MQILRTTTNPNANTFICDALCPNGYTPVEVLPQEGQASTGINIPQKRLEEIFREEIREYLRGLKLNNPASAVTRQAESSTEIAPTRSVNSLIPRNQPFHFDRVSSNSIPTLRIEIEDKSESWKGAGEQTADVKNVLTRFRDQRFAKTEHLLFTKDGRSYFLDGVDFCCLVDFNDPSKRNTKKHLVEYLNNGGVPWRASIVTELTRVPSTTEFIEALEHIRRDFTLGKNGTCTQDLEFIESLPDAYLDYLQQTADKMTYTIALKQIDEWKNAQIENPTWYL